MPRTMNELTAEQRVVVLAFAAQYGRTWKSKLAEAWQTGRDAAYLDGWALRQVRNTLGPKWLASVTL